MRHRKQKEAGQMTNEELARLLVQLRSGSLDALETIYLELRVPVMTVIVRIVRDGALAEDLTQDVFVKLWQTPPGEDVKSPRAWVFRVAHNLAVDALRRPGQTELPEHAAATGSTESVDTRIDVEAALMKLEARDREIVSLHLNAGLRFREVAQALELPLGTVLWRYSRAIGILRVQLDGGAK